MAVLDLIPKNILASLPTGGTEQEIAAKFLRMVEESPDVRARFARVFDKTQPTDQYPVPLYPKIGAFAPRDNVPAGLSMTVGPEGEVVGRYYEWGTCVIGHSTPGDCVTATPSPDGYNAYHQGATEVMMEDGTTETIPTGGMAIGHSHPGSSAEESIAHYNDITASLFNARSYEDEIGIYFVGSMVPGATYAEKARIEAAATSGHWGYIEGYTRPNGQRIRSGFQCFGPSAVIRPAAPLRREHERLPEMAASLGVTRQMRGKIVVTTIEDLKIGEPSGREIKACACSTNPVAEDEPVKDPVVANLSVEDQQALTARISTLETTLDALGKLVAEQVMKQIDTGDKVDEPAQV